MAQDRALTTGQALALAYAPARFRAAFTTIVMLDARFDEIVRRTREPQLARIKLAWWRDELARADGTANAADPLLRDCQALAHHHDVTVPTLALLAAAWMEAVTPDHDVPAFARQRGDAVFGAAAAIARATDGEAIRAAGWLWAIADASLILSDAAARAQAGGLLATIGDHRAHRRLPRTLRPFALLTQFALDDAAAAAQGKPPPSPPRRAWAALSFGWR